MANYYFKLKVLSTYNAKEAQFREIEFYNESGQKIDISKLSIIEGSNIYNGNNVNWNTAQLIDGVTVFNSSGKYGTNFAVGAPVDIYVILQSTEKFDSVKIYSDCQNGYSPKEVQYFVCESDTPPSKDSPLWIDLGKETYLNQLDTHEVVTKIYTKRMTLKNPSTNQHYSLAEKTLIPLPNTSSKNMILHGLEAGEEIQLDEAFDKIQYINELSTATQGTSGKIVTQKLLKMPNKILKISEVRM